MSIAHVETNGELRLAQHIIPNCKVVFDVGSRSDDYFVHLSEQCTFHLFEPMESHRGLLLEKVGRLPHVVVNDRALGNTNGRQELHPDSESICQRSNSRLPTVSIQIQRLDDYCLQQNVEQIDFLKIDTEGHELEVLKGGRNIIQSATKAIQFEYGGTYQDAGITLEMIFDFLGDKWSYYRVAPKRLVPLKHYKKSYEDFRYANYVASREPLDANVVGGSALQRLLESLWSTRKAA